MLTFEKQLYRFVSRLATGEVPAATLLNLAQDISEAIKLKVLDATEVRQDTPESYIRMSMLGKDLRQLMLAKKHGREGMSPKLLLTMMYGHLYEVVFVSLLKHAGVNFEVDTPVELKVDDSIIIPGELDIVIDGKVYDIKTASYYAFKNKYIDWQTLEEKDEFGYFGQLFGYAEARGLPAGGWIALDKSGCTWRTIPLPEPDTKEYKKLREKYVKLIIDNAKALVYDNVDIPPCTGVEEETFNGKKTGNKILGDTCFWCPYKDGICHTKVVEEPCRYSKAKNVKNKFYIIEE